jgi:hypothetical protein
MSIPERFSRIVKHKLTEIKDRIDQWDEEAQEDPEAVEKRRRARTRKDARRELDDSFSDPSAPSRTPVPMNPPRTARTPEEIARGTRTYASPTNGGANTAATMQPDPLDYHYRLLGVDTGADFTMVQAAYQKLAARCEPSRFPAGSPEAQQAQEIRSRLEVSYKILRDALDSTARRFDLLEFDSPGTAPPGPLGPENNPALG